MAAQRTSPPPPDVALRVRQAFLILPTESFLQPLRDCLFHADCVSECLEVAISGLHSVASAAQLPFTFVQESTLQRRFDGFHSAERIRNLSLEDPKSGLTLEAERIALDTAKNKMNNFVQTGEGSDFFRDEVVYYLDKQLSSSNVKAASQELLIQSLIGTWSVFESFSRSFIILWLNENPHLISKVLNSRDLKDYFGKQGIDFQTISDHGFDLSSSMGSIVFRGRRLDSLSTIKSILKALFDLSNVQLALGDDLWLLQQRRHLYSHNRGVIDTDYLEKTGESGLIGEKLIVTSFDLEKHLGTVVSAILAIVEASRLSSDREVTN